MNEEEYRAERIKFYRRDYVETVSWNIAMILFMVVVLVGIAIDFWLKVLI